MRQPVSSSEPLLVLKWVTRLGIEISKAGATIFCKLDQSAAAAHAGLELRPTTLIIFGNPQAGTKLMQAFPLAALDLPIKLLVWEDQGTVSVAYVPPNAIAERYGVSGMDAVLAAMEQQLDNLTRAVAVDAPS